MWSEIRKNTIRLIFSLSSPNGEEEEPEELVSNGKEEFCNPYMGRRVAEGGE